MQTAKFVCATVVWADPCAPLEVQVTAPAGATLAQAVAASGLAQRIGVPSAALTDLGVFNRLRPPETPLQDGDRIEVYLPLRVDPKEARRVRAEVRRRRRADALAAPAQAPQRGELS